MKTSLPTIIAVPKCTQSLLDQMLIRLRETRSTKRPVKAPKTDRAADLEIENAFRVLSEKQNPLNTPSRTTKALVTASVPKASSQTQWERRKKQQKIPKVSTFIFQHMQN